MPAENNIQNRVQQTIDTSLMRNYRISRIDQLYGDASYRKYYRAILDNKTSIIIMEIPSGKSSASEEITNYRGYNKELPFINIADFLKENKINVPSILCYNEKEGLLLLEDLGDELLFKKVESANSYKKISCYKNAVDLLVDLQKKTRDLKSNNCITYKRSFDQTLLDWEFDHFMEYGIEKRLNVKVDAADKEIYINETRKISKKILQTPYGFTHRDFQSRNIMIKENKLYLIDFQDALMGPRVYDLVALLRDSYVKLEKNEFETLIEYYCEKTGYNINTIKEEFNLVTCQRKLKDAGRFVYIDQVKGNPNYLKNIPTSLGYVKDALENLPEQKNLLEMLVKYIPEWD